MIPTLRRLRVAATTLALLLLTATHAHATTPDPRFSSVDPVLVGNSSGVAVGVAPAGFDVMVRSVNNEPVPGHFVTIDFSNTTMKLHAVQNPGTTIDCALRVIRQVTNASGAVKFAARVGGYSNTNAIEVYDEGVLLATVKGRSTDLDGMGGTTSLGDFVLFAQNFTSTAPETDFDQSGTTGLGDFVIFAEEYLRGTSAAAYCP